MPDDLMAGHNGRCGLFKVAIDDMEIGPANRASVDTDSDLAVPRGADP
jgi:hypothetical protein